MKIIDISRDIFDVPAVPNNPEPYIDEIKSMKQGAQYNLNALYTGLHTATHIDAPLHFIDDGAGMDAYPIDLFIGDCTVLEVPPGPLTGEYVEDTFPRGRERLLIKGSGKAFFIESGAYAAAQTGIRLIGIDRQSIGESGKQAGTHRAFLGRGIAIIEYLDLSDVTPGKYFLLAQPIKAGAFEASPCRAALIADHIFWSK